MELDTFWVMRTYAANNHHYCQRGRWWVANIIGLGTHGIISALGLSAAADDVSGAAWIAGLVVSATDVWQA
jgi:hypothetical protein